MARKGVGAAGGSSIMAPRDVPSASPPLHSAVAAAFSASSDNSSSDGVGVGLSLDFKDGKLVVKKLQDDGPAARSGA